MKNIAFSRLERRVSEYLNPEYENRIIGIETFRVMFNGTITTVWGGMEMTRLLIDYNAERDDPYLSRALSSDILDFNLEMHVKSLTLTFSRKEVTNHYDPKDLYTVDAHAISDEMKRMPGMFTEKGNWEPGFRSRLHSSSCEKQTTCEKRKKCERQ